MKHSDFASTIQLKASKRVTFHSPHPTDINPVKNRLVFRLYTNNTSHEKCGADQANVKVNQNTLSFTQQIKLSPHHADDAESSRTNCNKCPSCFKAETSLSHL